MLYKSYAIKVNICSSKKSEDPYLKISYYDVDS